MREAVKRDVNKSPTNLKKKTKKTQEIESLKEKSGQEYNETAREKEKLMDGEKRI
jgi:hypothetical protein